MTMSQSTPHSPINPMSDSTKEFIEDMGATFEAFGLTRMEGRLLGTLLVADPPEQSAQALADSLQVSRGSISEAVRRLEKICLVHRFSKLGERKDYFRVVPGAWNQIMYERAKATRTLRELMERGLSSVQDCSPQTQTNLEEALSFYTFWEDSFDLLIRHWEAGNTDPKEIFAAFERHQE
ncbi:MAG: MarR family transcriptional regulator [Deinococcota bacterium]